LRHSDSDFRKIQSFTWFRKCISGIFSFWAHFHLPMAGKNRAFRGCALSRSGHAAPIGRRVLLRNPYNRLRYLRAPFAVKVDACFLFEIGIPDRAVIFLSETMRVRLDKNLAQITPVLPNIAPNEPPRGKRA
jgi:hypothetical protein